MKRLLIIVLFLLSQLALAELAARYAQPPAPPVYPLRLEAYAHSPYWTPDFERLRLSMINIWEFNSEGYGLPEDTTGPITYRGGFRVVQGQPEHYQHTLWLLGDSAMADVAVPDGYTIADGVQARLSGYRVMNAGMGGQVAYTQVQRLKILPIQAGDIVLLYVGNDSYSVYQRLHRERGAEFACDILKDMALARSYCARPFGAAAVDAAVADMVSLYRRAVAEARSFVASRDAALIVTLRPYPWSRSLTAYEHSLLGPEGALLGQAEIAGRQGLQAARLHNLDLTHALDVLRDTTPVYVDGSHVNEYADAVIARAIYDQLTVY